MSNQTCPVWVLSGGGVSVQGGLKTTPPARAHGVVDGFGLLCSTLPDHSSQGSPQAASTAARSWPSTVPSPLRSAGQVVVQSSHDPCGMNVPPSRSQTPERFSVMSVQPDGAQQTPVPVTVLFQTVLG